MVAEKVGLDVGGRTLLAVQRAGDAGRCARTRRAERGGEVHAAPHARGRARTGGRCRPGARFGTIAHYRQDLAQVPPNRRSTTSSTRFGRHGDGVRCRDTSDGSDSPATRCCERAARCLGRARAGRTRDDDAVRRQSPGLRRADGPSRRRIDRGARGCDRGVRRNGHPREPRPRAAPAHSPPATGFCTKGSITDFPGGFAEWER